MNVKRILMTRGMDNVEMIWLDVGKGDKKRWLVE